MDKADAVEDDPERAAALSRSQDTRRTEAATGFDDDMPF